MGGQGFERREILRYIGIASVAATFPGFHRWSFACPAHLSDVPAARQTAASYKPLLFSPDQFRLVEHIAEMTIPADDTAGAREAGVTEFIDFMVANRVAVSRAAKSGPQQTRFGRAMTPKWSLLPASTGSTRAASQNSKSRFSIARASSRPIFSRNSLTKQS
jgi:hypothetical protein